MRLFSFFEPKLDVTMAIIPHLILYVYNKCFLIFLPGEPRDVRELALLQVTLL